MNHLLIIFTIAYNSFRGFSRDRIFHATLLFSLALVLFSYALSTLTIVESQKILLDFSFTAISLSGILIAIFLGISSASREIESKVIYTILSKPISRIHYLLGKYLGCTIVLIIAHCIMSSTLTLIMLALGTGLPVGILACFYFMLLESLFLLATALFASIFSSSILATTFSLATFFIGRNAYFFKSASEKAQLPFVKNLFRALYDLLPNLDRFNIREVVAYSKPYPHEMLYLNTIYYAVYAVFFLCISIYFFTRKDMP